MILRTIASLGILACLTFSATAGPADEEKQAEQLLNSARRAYNDGNARTAADQFAEFLKKFDGNKGRIAAKFGLGLALLDLPDHDYAKALQEFSAPANDSHFPDRPLALYYLAVSHRGLGLWNFARTPDSALPQFTEAARFFGKAVEAFAKRNAGGDADWDARARCDKAEMELRLNKPKEARATVEPFLKEPALAKSKSRPLALFYHGFACFLQGEVPAAGKSLGLVAPFNQPFGPHAQYLLGRVHQLSDEKAEAAVAFHAVIEGYEKQKKDAAEALKQPARFKNDPWEKARLESLVKGPAPDYLAGANFYAGVLDYEGGKFGEALPRFQSFAKEFTGSPLAAEALLRAGYCLVQLKQYGEAVKVLRPLADQERRLSDQALYWLGKAQFGQAQAVDPNNKAGREKAMQTSLATLRAAAGRAGELAAKDDAAAERKVEILIESADVLLASGHAAEAAAGYETAWKAKPPAARGEEVLQRFVSALQIAGQHNPTITWSGIFEEKFPKSLLLPEVLFRKAESYHARAEQLAKLKDKTAATEASDKAIALYQRVIAKSPEFERIPRVRFGLAVLYADQGEWDKAAEVIETIPGPDRVGESAGATLLLADCLIRTAPAKADDALADNMLREKLGNAVTLLDGFVTANPKSPESADALLKLGFCHKRIAVQLADPKEKNEAFTKARTALDRVQKEFAASPVAGQALLERARVRLLQGDRNGAAEDLRAFTRDPKRNDSVAPLAAIALATMLREQNKPREAMIVMKEARDRNESHLAGDPRKAEWLNLLRFHHGAALLDAGQSLEARALFETTAGAMAGKLLGAEAALMAERAMAQDFRKRLDDAEAERRKAGKEDQIRRAEGRLKSAQRDLIEQARHMERRADALKPTQPPQEARGRLYYEAAWVYRLMAPFAPLNPKGRAMTAADAKESIFKEMLAATRAAYTHAIAAAPDTALAVESRFELAEIEADTGHTEMALKLLKEALDLEPTDRPTAPELAERVRFRIGAAEFDRAAYDIAKAQFDAIAANPKSPLRGLAMYRAAECFFAQGKFEEAKNALKPFRDDPALQHVHGVSDRAMLRLGHAYAAVKNWESSRVVLETMLNRYGDTPWKAEARYGIGWALLNQNRHDEAVRQFTEVTALKTDDLAGRAHLQIGLCRAAQKKYDEAVKAFMTVAYGYDAPELKYAAMLEAARALADDKKPAEAIKLLEKIMADTPADSEWAKAAKERLGQMKK